MQPFLHPSPSERYEGQRRNLMSCRVQGSTSSDFNRLRRATPTPLQRFQVPRPHQALRDGVVGIAFHFQQALRKSPHIFHPQRPFPSGHCCHLAHPPTTASFMILGYAMMLCTIQQINSQTATTAATMQNHRCVSCHRSKSIYNISPDFSPF